MAPDWLVRRQASTGRSNARRCTRWHRRDSTAGLLRALATGRQLIHDRGRVLADRAVDPVQRPYLMKRLGLTASVAEVAVHAQGLLLGLGPRAAAPFTFGWAGIARHDPGLWPGPGRVPGQAGSRARHGIENFAVIADAGMLSAANLAALDVTGCKFIVGSRLTKAPIDLESHFRWHGDYFGDGQVIDTLTPKTGHNHDNDTALLAEPVCDPQAHPTSWRAVWAYSRNRAARDTKTLTAQENRARDVITGAKAARTPRFVKTAKGRFVLDEAALARARRLAGLKGYVTNIPASVMPATEVITSYHDLWHVEQSFRMSKTDLAARPMFARTRDAIEAHLTIVFTALAISRTVQNRTGRSLRRVLRTLRPLRSATIEINGTTHTSPPALGPDEITIINALKDPNPRR
jgi:hypothetical protein